MMKHGANEWLGSKAKESGASPIALGACAALFTIIVIALFGLAITGPAPPPQCKEGYVYQRGYCVQGYKPS